MKHHRLRNAASVYPSPSPSPRHSLAPREASPCPPFLEDYDLRHCRVIMSTSRPSSEGVQPVHAFESSICSPPSLREILTNSAPPPWTLSAFMAYLSQNHCMETLEFTMDAERYRVAYGEVVQDPASWMRDGQDHVCSLWQKLIHAYIVPYAPREVNLPSRVRDRLLSLPSLPDPPEPSELDEAVSIVYELMNDSVLVPFLASVMVHPSDSPAEADSHHHDSRQGRSRIRTPKDSSSGAEESSRSPKMSFLPQLSISRGGASAAHRSGSSSADAAENDSLTDDTGSTGSPPGLEPMTPPTTPPTSDWAFSTSPASLQRAISAHSSSWRKVGAKLGLSRKGREKRSAPDDAIPRPPTGSSDGSGPDGHIAGL